MRVCSLKAFVQLSIVTLVLAVVLAFGFLPTCFQLYGWVAQKIDFGHYGTWVQKSFFVLGALFFHYSIPRPKLSYSGKNLLQISVLPILIGLGFGYFHPSPSFWSQPLEEAFWWIVIAPIGEELLFRGWVYSLGDRLSRSSAFPMTQPLPVALWMSTFAFSIWHLQNFLQFPAGLVAFQIFYTLFVGFWLGYLRWKTGGLWLPILAHMLLNASASIL